MQLPLRMAVTILRRSYQQAPCRHAQPPLSRLYRSAEAVARNMLAGLDLPDWTAGDAAAAEPVLIDLDSIYRQMASTHGLAAQPRFWAVSPSSWSR